MLAKIRSNFQFVCIQKWFIWFWCMHSSPSTAASGSVCPSSSQPSHSSWTPASSPHTLSGDHGGVTKDYLTYRRQCVNQSISCTPWSKTAKYMVLRLPVCKCMCLAVLPGPVQPFWPVQHESLTNIWNSTAPFIAFFGKFWRLNDFAPASFYISWYMR
jgi:hypothetical protein